MLISGCTDGLLGFANSLSSIKITVQLHLQSLPPLTSTAFHALEFLAWFLLALTS